MSLHVLGSVVAFYGFHSRSVTYRSLVRSCVILDARCRGCVACIVLDPLSNRVVSLHVFGSVVAFYGFRSRSVNYRSLVRSCGILHALCRGGVVLIVLLNSELPGAGRHSDVSMGPPNPPSPPNPPNLVWSVLP